MSVIAVTGWGILLENVRCLKTENVEAPVAAVVVADPAEEAVAEDSEEDSVKSATSVTDSDTSLGIAKRPKIVATVATAPATSPKTVNRARCRVTIAARLATLPEIVLKWTRVATGAESQDTSSGNVLKKATGIPLVIRLRATNNREEKKRKIRERER